MKKFMLVALLLAVGVSFAFASSLKVPWFVDNADATSGQPPALGAVGVIFLASNSAEDLTCYIQYYNQDGVEVGSVAAGVPGASATTFSIPALASIAFRPVADDSAGNVEGAAGRLVPNRGTNEATPKKNGSCKISWEDTAVATAPGVYAAPDSAEAKTAVQGAYRNVAVVSGTDSRLMVYGHLLPPGA